MANDLTVIGTNYSQQHQRRYLRCVDQHGRRWGVNVEIRNNSPTGNWEWYFISPWVPGAKYLKHTMDRPNRVFIDYDAIIKEMREAQKEYDVEVSRAMRKRYREGDWASRPVDQDIMDKFGQRPGPVEPWVACKQGNKYALGLTQEIDERLVPFLPVDLAEKAAEAEMDFADDDWDGIDEELAEQEREDNEAMQQAWNQPRTIPGGAAERSRQTRPAKVEPESLEEMFDAEALGGKKFKVNGTRYVNAMKGKRKRDRAKVQSADPADSKADLLETE